MGSASINKYAEPSRFAKGVIDELPYSIAKKVSNRWLAMANKPAPGDRWKGTEWDDQSHEADLYVLNIAKLFRHKWTMPLDASASDEDICEEARKLADENRQYWDEVMARVVFLKQLLRGADPVEVGIQVNGLLLAKLAEMARRSELRGVSVADLMEDKSKQIKAIAKRLCDELFCRRRMRKAFNRVREEIARNQFGEVSNRRGLYVSNDSLASRKNQRARNQALLDAVEMINELGQEFKLSELVEKSNANPAIRRAELMVRIAGFELIAKDLGHCGEFITLTCPSAYHAVHFKSGQLNEKFNGTTPRDAAAYLGRVWARIRAQLGKEGIRIYGFRVAEPHHDGTPHWHGLFFMEKEKVMRFRQIVAMHGCRQDSRELGLKYFQTAADRREAAKKIQAKQKTWMPAAGRKVKSLAEIEKDLPVEAEYWASADFFRMRKAAPRVEFTHINWKRGSAAGYIAKYIAKNIDGKNANNESIGADYEALEMDSAASTAERVDAWAAVWGVRQFQQIGGASVSVWRELRRLNGGDENDNSDLMRAAAAADCGDWAKFIMIMGGIDCPRDARPVALYKEDFGELNRYGEPCQPVTRGVIEVGTGVFKICHVHDWVLKKGGVAAPWTGVNNCNNSESFSPEAFNGAAFSDSEAVSGNKRDFAGDFAGAYDFEAAEIREWLRARGEFEPADIEPLRVVFRQQRMIEEADLDAIRMPQAVIDEIVAAASAGAQVLKQKSDGRRALKDQIAGLNKLIGRRRGGIERQAAPMDLSAAKTSARKSRMVPDNKYPTVEELIKHSRGKRMAMMAELEAEAAKAWKM